MCKSNIAAVILVAGPLDNLGGKDVGGGLGLVWLHMVVEKLTFNSQATVLVDMSLSKPTTYSLKSCHIFGI